MANPKNTAELAELKNKFAEADSIVLTEYRGLTVGQLQQLRGIGAVLRAQADADLGADARIAERDLLLPGDQLQRGVEARGVAGREQLLGVRAVAAAAHLRGDREVQCDAAVRGLDVAVAAGAGGDGLGGVEGADLDHAVPSLPVTGPGGGPEARVARLRAHERA